MKKAAAVLLLLLLCMAELGACGGFQEPETAAAANTSGAAIASARESEAASTAADHTELAESKRILQFGGYDWMVLAEEEGKMLLLAEAVLLGGQPYDVPGGDAVWASCALREYLNGAFYQSFSAEDQALILLTALDNGTGPATEDHIFPLSLEELGRYFSLQSTAEGALQCDALQEDREFPPVHYWWLREQGETPGAAMTASDFTGEINRKGVAADSADGAAGSHYGCVRPALWLKTGEA